MEEDLGDEIVHRFKAMENIIIISARLQLFDKMRQYHDKLLSLISKVARNDVSDAINNILDAVQKHLSQQIDEQRHMYSMTLNVLKDSNQQLWFTISLRLGKILLDQQKYEELDRLLTQLKEDCKKTGTDADGDTIMSSSKKS